MMEVWKDVKGYEGRYQVSNEGRVKSLPNSRRFTELILKPSPHVRSGHLIVNLTDSENGKWRQRPYYVHTLVLSAFVGMAPAGQEGCHEDGVPANNRLSNLRWDTKKGNAADKKRHGTENVGERNGMSKLTLEQVVVIKAKLAKGEKVGVLAKEYGVYHGAISGIKNGRRWKDA